MSAEESDAVDAFAISYGRRWRSALVDCFERARYPYMSDEQSAILQGLRNRRGTSWIKTHKTASKYGVAA